MNNDSNNINSSNDTIGQINNTIEGNKTLEINISNQPVSNVNSESNSNIYIIEQPEQHQNIAQISNTNSSNYGTKYSNETINIFHFDVYRLADIDEFYAIGGPEYFENGISIIEWGELIESILPLNYIKVEIIKDNKCENIRYIKIRRKSC